MAAITFPNQRTICVHRERAESDFLGIKNENWKAAARNLSAHAFKLYIYLASNKDNYKLALSPAAVRQEIGMARSTYHDQFHVLVDKGYLVPAHGSTFDFYEVPQSGAQLTNSMTSAGQVNENGTSDGQQKPGDGFNVLGEDIEINNIATSQQLPSINKDDKDIKEVEKYIPQQKEIIIKPPRAEGKLRPKSRSELEEKEFTF